MTQKASQDKLLQFRMMEARLESLANNRELVARRLIELESTMASLDELSRTKGEFNFHVGDGVFFPAKADNDGKIIVTVGADVAAEKTVEEAKKMLQGRKSEAEAAIKQAQREIEELTRQLEAMIPEIEAMHGH